MVSINKKKVPDSNDDTLFGLLSHYKWDHSYFQVLVSRRQQSLVVLLTDNPGNWNQLSGEYRDEYRPLRRLELGVHKMSVKYLSPDILLWGYGPTLGIKGIPTECEIEDKRDTSGLYLIRASLQVKPEITEKIKRILHLNSQRKYEMLEKYALFKQGK